MWLVEGRGEAVTGPYLQFNRTNLIWTGVKANKSDLKCDMRTRRAGQALLYFKTTFVYQLNSYLAAQWLVAMVTRQVTKVSCKAQRKVFRKVESKVQPSQPRPFR